MSKLCLSKIFLILILTTLPLIGQTKREESILEEYDENVSPEMAERLLEIRRNPIDLNSATLKQLESLPLISPIEAHKIVLNRDKEGRFRSWNDFIGRLKFDRKEWESLRVYFVISRSENSKPQIILRQRNQIKYPKTSGFITGKYSGTPLKSYSRLRLIRNKNIYGSLLLQKDAGEQMWDDHLAGFIGTNILSGSTHIIAGNFFAEFGHGLVLSRPYGFFKCADPTMVVKRYSRGIGGYDYSEENNFFQGVALSSRIYKNLYLSFFGSHKAIDATINSDGSIKNFPSSGLHRTRSEIKTKDRIKENLGCIRIEYLLSRGSIGITGWKNSYSRSVDRKDRERYRFVFNGKRNALIGLDYDLYLGEINLTGEIARSASSGWSLISSTIIDCGKMIMVLSFRHFDPEFQNPHGHGFSTNRISNEQGFYTGIRWKICSKTAVSCFYDLFKMPWRTYSVPVPTRCSDGFIQIEQRITPLLYIEMRARLRKSQVMSKYTSDSKLNFDYLRARTQLLTRMQIFIKPGPGFHLKTRLEKKSVIYPVTRLGNNILAHHYKESGLLFYQHLSFNINQDIAISGCWITFDSESYDSRLYEFENDLPGTMTIIPLYGKGTRWYVLVKWRVAKYLKLSLKYSSTYHYGADSWGTGNDRIKGDTENKFGVQIDLVI